MPTPVSPEESLTEPAAMPPMLTAARPATTTTTTTTAMTPTMSPTTSPARISQPTSRRHNSHALANTSPMVISPPQPVVCEPDATAGRRAHLLSDTCACHAFCRGRAAPTGDGGATSRDFWEPVTE